MRCSGVWDAFGASHKAVYWGERGENVAVNGNRLANAFSAWPACRMFQRERVLCFSHLLSTFHRLLWLLLCFFQLPQRMECSLTKLIRKRERVPAQQVDMIIAQWREAFHILWYDLHPSSSHLLQRSIHVQRIPEHHGIDDQPQGSKLLFLPFTIALAYLSLLSKIGRPCQAMATFAFV